MSRQVSQLRAILQGHFGWHKARITFTAAFILSLVKLNRVNFTKLANALNGQVKPQSNYRRIQRFFAEFDLPYEAVTRLILHLLPIKTDFTVSIDRTNWKLGKFNINILTAGIIYEGVAFPICWMLLPKRGNSNSDERIDLMKQVLTRIPKSHIRVVVADREFIGREWFRWLDTQNIPFVIRIKENALVSRAGGDIPIKKLFENLHIHQQVSLQRPCRVYDLPVYVSALRLKDQYLILASNQHQQGQAALDAYKERWGIEVLFANLKSRGFNLEETHLIHQDRIEKLIALLAIACTWAHIIGEWIAKTNPLKVKNHGRREKSLFRYGLDHLQYVLLNINHQYQQFRKCIRLLRNPPLCKPS